MQFDSRRNRRLRLKRPAPAMTGLGRVDILDCSPTSMGIRHEFEVERGTTTWLEFTWSGLLIRLDCEVRSSRRPRGDDAFRSGLAIRAGFSAEVYRKRVEAELDKMKV